MEFCAYLYISNSMQQTIPRIQNVGSEGVPDISIEDLRDALSDMKNQNGGWRKLSNTGIDKAGRHQVTISHAKII